MYGFVSIFEIKFVFKDFMMIKYVLSFFTQIKLAELEHRLLGGASEKIQLGSLISAFQITRDMVKDSV